MRFWRIQGAGENSWLYEEMTQLVRSLEMITKPFMHMVSSSGLTEAASGVRKNCS